MEKHQSLTVENGNQHKVAVHADYNYLLRLTLVLVLSLSPLTIAGYFLSVSRWNTLSILVVEIFLGIGIFLLFWMMSYVLGVVLERGPVFVFDGERILETVSYMKLGRIPIKEIQTLSLVNGWIQDFLVIRLVPDSSVWNHARDRRSSSKIFAWLLPDQIWIPVDFLEAEPSTLLQTVDNIKRAIISESHLRKKSSIADSVGSPRVEIAEIKLTHKSPGKSEGVKGKDSLRGVDRSSPEGPPLSPVSRSNTLLSRIESFFAHHGKDLSGQRKRLKMTATDVTVRQKVKDLRQRVQDSQLDRLICDLYLDYIRYFVGWAASSSQRVPVGVTNPRQIGSGASLEEICFEYENQPMCFRLNRIERSHGFDTYLAVLFKKQEVFVLRVKVEIGELDPKNLKRYIPGPWEDKVKDLFEACQMARGERFEVLHEISAITEVAETTEDLRKNFGIFDEDE